MKVYSIGREQGCDILINDRTDVISRRHATLNVETFGKMTIVDQSTNGTYVNGIRISPNVPVPVTRKDNISFAHVARLDWDQVPKGSADYLKWSAVALVALLIIFGAVFGVKKFMGPSETAPTPAEQALDSIERVRKAEQLKKQEEQRKDSIEKIVKDSMNKVERARRALDKKKADDKRQAEDKKKADAKKKVDAEKKAHEGTPVKRAR